MLRLYLKKYYKQGLDLHSPSSWDKSCKVNFFKIVFLLATFFIHLLYPSLDVDAIWFMKAINFGMKCRGVLFLIMHVFIECSFVFRRLSIYVVFCSQYSGEVKSVPEENQSYAVQRS